MSRAPSLPWRPTWRREVALVGGSFLLFPLVALVAPGDLASALARTERLVAVERALHVHVEDDLHRWLVGHPLLEALAGVVYLGAHVPMLVGTFVVLAVRRPELYRRTRDVFLVAHLLTIAVYVALPTAPPRLLPGAPDRGTPGTSGGIVHHLQYELAAVPSGHVVFAGVVWWGLRASGASRWRRVGEVHLLVTLALVLLTGHHLLADALAAGAVLGAAVALVTAADRADALDPAASTGWSPTTTRWIQRGARGG